MKYTHTYFKKDYPDWKRKKDSWLVRNLFRPLSFYTASFSANRGITANQVSFISMFVGILASSLYLLSYKWCHVAGAVLVIFWMVMDCTDGNLARSVKKQSYGDFADGISSYVLINILFLCLGMEVFFSGGILVAKENVWIVFCGALTGSFDSLARLVYQKFVNTETVLENEGRIKKEERSSVNNHHGIRYLHSRFTREVGLNGIFLPVILICSIFDWLDIFVLFYMFVFFTTFAGTLFTLIKKVLKINKGE